MTLSPRSRLLAQRLSVGHSPRRISGTSLPAWEEVSGGARPSALLPLPAPLVGGGGGVEARGGLVGAQGGERALAVKEAAETGAGCRRGSLLDNDRMSLGMAELEGTPNGVQRPCPPHDPYAT